MSVAPDGRPGVTIPPAVRWSEVAYVCLRLGVAVLFVFHVPQKVFGWWGSEPSPPLSVRGLASGIELVASPLIAVGYLTSWAALVAAVEMVGAYLVVHVPRGGWPIENRGEVALLYFLVFVYIAVRGGGAYSLDARQRDSSSRRILIGMAAAAAILICMGTYVYSFAADRARIGGVDATARGIRLFVTNEMSGDLSEIDAATGTVARTAPLGKRPRGIRISPDQRSLYVALSGSPNAGPGVDPATLPPPDRSADGIGEVDIATLRIKRIIHAGADPEQLDISPDGTRLYVANEDAATLSVVNVPSGQVIAAIKVGDEPEGVAVRPDGKVVYVTSEADGTVSVIDTARYTLVARIAVGHRPRGVAFLPDGSRAYVTLENDAAFTIVDAIRHRFVQLVPLNDPGLPKPRPMGIAVGPDGSSLFITTGSQGRLSFFNPVTNQPAGSLAVGQRPWGVALMPDGRTAYTANGPSNDVSVVDVATREVLKRIPVGARPWGIVTAGYANVRTMEAP
jgi:YVTN family beta-propeller protein